MNGTDGIAAIVGATELIGPGLRRVTLGPAAGGRFAAAAAGAHILLEMRGTGRVWRNAYSLVSSTAGHYSIIVRRVPGSRGGSAYIHDHLRPGASLTIAGPGNSFPIAKTARKHLMLAGGIGVTPFLSYVPVLAAAGLAHELHVRCRADDQAPFETLLASRQHAHIHAGDAKPPLDVPALLAAQPVGTHLYLCGPERFMTHVTEIADALGWPPARRHQEHFGASASGNPFRAVLARSGITVDVSGDQGLLDAIEAAGVDAPCLCRGGACGECRLTVLAGEPDHRDHFLTLDERARNDSIMPCVSRAMSDVLVVDI